MIIQSGTQIEKRLQSLERHLKQENPVLLRVVQSFRDLDRVAYRMGLLDKSESYATRVSWWPLISILGTFSSGKSTFINSFLKTDLQRTGNQAVDDKFTVVCYSKEGKVHTLPGLALDADPRFPFYQISQQIEQVVEGEGRRIDAYLQLKTCPTEKLRGKILIDSPGFDADAQRTSTLRITDHIMNLSDLVLVFFDARHPEPGAMRDTLEHLVANTIHRHDSNKFLFVLNQIDCTVRDDNLEDVVAAWQRALAQAGLTAGRFYQIYNKESANPIEDESLRKRYEEKCDEDLDDLLLRVQQVEVERAYRIIGVLESTVRMIQDEAAPKLTELLRRWRKLVLMGDAGLLAAAATVAVWGLLKYHVSWPGIDGLNWQHAAGTGGALMVVSWIHFLIRRIAAGLVARKLPQEIRRSDLLSAVTRAFKKNTAYWRPVLSRSPMGWGALTKRRLLKVLKDTDEYVQNLNDQFTNPSGKAGIKNPKVQLEIAES